MLCLSNLENGDSEIKVQHTVLLFFFKRVPSTGDTLARGETFAQVTKRSLAIKYKIGRKILTLEKGNLFIWALKKCSFTRCLNFRYQLCVLEQSTLYLWAKVSPVYFSYPLLSYIRPNLGACIPKIVISFFENN